MYHPVLLYEQVKLKMAEDIRRAERDRLIRQAGASRPDGSIDSVPFRERVSRLFGGSWPTARGAAAGA
jgi:hypothetical protein